VVFVMRSKSRTLFGLLVKARKENFFEDTIAAGREPCVKQRKAMAQVK
jgi:hypothetical protein